MCSPACWSRTLTWYFDGHTAPKGGATTPEEAQRWCVTTTALGHTQCCPQQLKTLGGQLLEMEVILWKPSHRPFLLGELRLWIHLMPMCVSDSLLHAPQHHHFRCGTPSLKLHPVLPSGDTAQLPAMPGVAEHQPREVKGSCPPPQKTRLYYSGSDSLI